MLRRSLYVGAMRRMHAIVALVACACAGPHKQEVKLKPIARPPAFTLSANARLSKLQAIVIDLPIGYRMGEASAGSSACTESRPLINKSNAFDLKTDSYEDVFNTAMKKYGYPVDDQIEIFKDTKEHAADVRVAARVIAAQFNECYRHYGDENRVEGNAYLKIDWSLYSVLEKKVIGHFVTEGATPGDVKSEIGEAGIIRVAFGDAAERLALTSAYRATIDPGPSAPIATREAAKVHVHLAQAFAGDLNAHLAAVKRAVVTVTANRGSGSGFVISPEGVVLTAAHVVTGSKFAKITTAAGKECYGEVAATSPKRDLAIVSVDCDGLAALPLLREKLPEGSEVFAIGTPLGDDLKFSVTKGVVSGLRKYDSLDYIQSDVKILPGSSGGPLLDVHGNAVGVASGGIGIQQVPVGVNFFVPVADLDKYLPIDLN